MVHRADHLAGPASVEPDWSRPAARITDEATKGWTDDANAKAVQEAGVRLVRGHGRLVAPGVVEVDGVEYEASRGVVLNTGTEPLVLPIDGLAETPYWTNRDVVQVTELPAQPRRSSAVARSAARSRRRSPASGSPSPCSRRRPAARGRGARVERAASPRLFEAEGITVHTGVRVDRVEHDGAFVLTAGDLRVEAERLLVAAGRSNNVTRHRAREPSASTRTRRPVETDERMRAGDKLWAIGDITGHGRFTHVSSYQAEVAKADILGEDGPVADYRAVSRVTFTDPEIGSVGLSEEQAREQGLDVRTGFADISGSARGWLDGEGNEGHIKLVADAATGLLVGATTMGRTGGDLVAMLALAIHAKVPPSVVRRMHFAFPTYHGSVMTALDDLGL